MAYARVRRPIWPYVVFVLAALVLALVSATDAGAWPYDARRYDAQPYRAGSGGASAGARAVATSEAIVYALPESCVAFYDKATTRHFCDNVWYAQRYYGATVVYVVVKPPETH